MTEQHGNIPSIFHPEKQGVSSACEGSSMDVPINQLFQSITHMLHVWNPFWIFTNICPKNHPNVGKYTIHGAYGLEHTQRNIAIDESNLCDPQSLN